MISKRATRRRLGQGGFSLIELSVVIVIVTLLLGAILVPLQTQIDQSRIAENTRRVAAAKDALYAFAMTHGRLPCPDDPATTAAAETGQEEFAVGGTAANGQCKVFDGFLPGTTLGLTNLDGGGHYMDGWASAQNRVRYAVTSHNFGAGDPEFTRSNGMKSLTFSQLGGLVGLSVCTTATGIDATSCNTAVPLINQKAVAVIYSLGKNAPEIISGAVVADADEAANRNGDVVFVMHDQTNVTGNVFDDQVEWVSVYALIGQMVTAGTLP